MSHSMRQIVNEWYTFVSNAKAETQFEVNGFEAKGTEMVYNEIENVKVVKEAVDEEKHL